jgi:hypothetical protein
VPASTFNGFPEPEATLLPNSSLYMLGMIICPAWLHHLISTGRLMRTSLAKSNEFAPKLFRESCAPEVLHIVASLLKRRQFAGPKLEETPAPPVSRLWIVTVLG